LEPSAAEFVAYAKLLCGATADASVLDIGCGFGMLGLRLKPFLRHPGRYVGVDVDHRAIRWAKRHVVSDNASFEFLYLDVRNDAYNPSGTHRATEFDIPVPSRSFDLIVHKSVFTHLRPEEVRNYLAQTARLLKPGGTCLATFFLLNEVQARSAKEGHNTIDFRFGDPTWRFAVREMPELAVAYAEEALQSWVAAAGLTTKRTYYGTWTGRPDGLSYQDMLLLGHP
jgi:SAM-dependent methyltransferase